jgi:hypothetical protein
VINSSNNGPTYPWQNVPGSLSPLQRIQAAGFPAAGNPLYAESIAVGSGTVDAALKGLIVDTGDPVNLGHRRQLLGMDVFKPLNQAGVGIIQNLGPWGFYYTLDTARTADPRPFLTGVVFKDLNKNGRYDIGEGLGGVTVSVSANGVKVGSTTTWASGGYSLQLNPGTYTVTVSGGAYGTPLVKTVILAGQNVRFNATVQPITVAPKLTGPASAAPGTSALITWTAVPGATAYVVHFVHVTQPTALSFGQAVGFTTVTGTSYQLTNLQPDQYRITVSALNAAGQPGPASAGLVIAVPRPKPVTPLVLSPAAGQTLYIAGPAGAATVKWTGIMNVVRYDVLVSGPFGSYLLPVNSPTTTSLTVPLPYLHLGLNPVYVRVRAVNAKGVASDWSPLQTFYVYRPV